MATNLNRLSARQVVTLPEGLHNDGGNLYLRVTGTGARRWVVIFQWDGKRREMGLGGLDKVTLKAARDMAADARELIARKIDPIAERRRAVAEREAEAKRLAEEEIEEAAKETFGSFTQKLLHGYTDTSSGKAVRVESVVSGFANAKHRQQWRNTLTTYCAPIWDMPIDEIRTIDVANCLSPIWKEKPETASRTLNRIKEVLRAAISKNLIPSGQNAALRENVEALLPKRGRVEVKHHPSLPYAELPAFWARLADLDSVSACACALRLTILCATRSGETRLATWGEIDLKARTWTIPADRMKMRRAHRIPLTDAALAVLEEAKKFRHARTPDELLFPSIRDRVALSDMAFLQCLRGIRPGITTHGFRATFKDWAADQTTHQREVIEQALAHTISNAVEAAYRRSDAFEKRRALMSDWANYVTSAATKD